MPSGVVVAYSLLLAVGQTEISQSPWRPYLLSAILVVPSRTNLTSVQLRPGLRYLGLMTYSYYQIHTMPGYFLGAAYRRVTDSAYVPVWMGIIFSLLALPLSYLFMRLH